MCLWRCPLTLSGNSAVGQAASDAVTVHAVLGRQGATKRLQNISARASLPVLTVLERTAKRRLLLFLSSSVYLPQVAGSGARSQFANFIVERDRRRAGDVHRVLSEPGCILGCLQAQVFEGGYHCHASSGKTRCCMCRPGCFCTWVDQRAVTSVKPFTQLASRQQQAFSAAARSPDDVVIMMCRVVIMHLLYKITTAKFWTSVLSTSQVGPYANLLPVIRHHGNGPERCSTEACACDHAILP